MTMAVKAPMLGRGLACQTAMETEALVLVLFKAWMRRGNRRGGSRERTWLMALMLSLLFPLQLLRPNLLANAKHFQRLGQVILLIIIVSDTIIILGLIAMLSSIITIFLFIIILHIAIITNDMLAAIILWIDARRR